MPVDMRQRRRRASDRRAAILEAVAVAAERFIQDLSLDKHLPQILERLGEATGVSRGYFFENHPGDDGALLTSQRYEWAATGIEPQMSNPDLQDLPWLTVGMGRWVSLMSKGQPVCGHVRDFPSSEREMLEPQGIRSIVVVPVIVGGDWHGFIGFDECTGEREWTADELDALKAAAGIVGAAIERRVAEEARQRELAERSRAEQELKEHREHLEELVQARTAELAEANERLRREIVEREQAQRELEAQRTLSMRSDRLRSLGEMAAGMAHELNQPLQGVRGLAQQLAIAVDRGWDETKETVRDRAREIVEQVDRMTHVIEHVRMFAREAGKPDLSSVDVNGVVRSSLSMLRAQCEAHGIDIGCELAETLPPVRANPFSLEEVFVNLLLNARDAVEEQNGRRPSRTPCVLLRTELRQEDAGSSVAVEVIDNGVGIPGDAMDKVFDPFFTTKEPHRGTGLGLSISRSIVETFGGTIDIKSMPGRETRVTVSLPTRNTKEWQP